MTDHPDANRFAELSAGNCHFRLSGDGAGPTLLLLHGATVPGWQYDRLVPYLNEAGFHTICPDFYGHGNSARPDVRYNHELFVNQVSELLEWLELMQPISIVGHSMGAAIGARFACEYPSRVDRLVLTAPLLNFASQQPVLKFLQVPVLGELMVHGYIKPMLVRRRNRIYGPIEDGRFARMFREQYDVPGFGRAFLSLVRNGGLGDQSDCYETLQDLHHPTLILRGSEDDVLIAEQLETIRHILPRASVRQLQGLGHSMMMTHPELVASCIVEFLGQDHPPNRLS